MLAHFHWTYDYLMNEIPWSVVQMMLADQIRYESEKQEKEVNGYDDLFKMVQKANGNVEK